MNRRVKNKAQRNVLCDPPHPAPFLHSERKKEPPAESKALPQNARRWINAGTSIVFLETAELVADEE